jgi:hypothetical protein
LKPDDSDRIRVLFVCERLGALFHGCDETVAAARHGFKETRVLRIVAQRGAYLANAEVYAGFEIDVCAIFPEGAPDLIPADELTGPLG